MYTPVFWKYYEGMEFRLYRDRVKIMGLKKVN